MLVPPGVVTVMPRVPSVAPDDVLIVAVMVVELTTVTAPTDTPLAGATTLTVAPLLVNPVPKSVTGVGVPRRPAAGLIEPRVGAGGATTVNVTALLVPAGVATVTFLAVSAALAEIVNVVFSSVSLTTVMPPTVMPPPDTLT